MRANRQRRSNRPRGAVVTVGFAAVLSVLVFAALGCGGSTPMDQWITMNPEAGAGFEVPAREVILRSDGGADAATDGGPTGDDGGASTDDAAAGNDATGDAGDTVADAAAD